MAGYSTRQSTYTTGDVIAAADTNDEFNQLISAFNASTGHTHDGTAGDGGPVSVLRDSNAYNRILLDDSNNHLEFYVNVSSSSVQQLRIQDGAIVPITDNDIDLGTSLLEFKNLYIDGTANIDSLVADTADINAGTVDAVIGGTTPAAGTFTTLTANTSLALASGATVTAILDEDTMSSDSATAIATQQSIKAYVDTEIAALPIGDITAVNAGTGLSGGGITGSVTLSIDTGTTVDLSTAQILTNKTLTAPVISTISNTGTLTLPTSTDTLVGKATTDILTNKTLTSPVLNGTLSGTAFLDEDTMSSDSATAVASQQSIKAYVDAQVATANELSELTDVNITTPADGALLFYDTGTSTWIDNVVSGDITIADTGVAAIGSGVIINDDVNASAAIAYSKLSLTDSILNADINSAADIADTKLATLSTANKVSLSALDIDGATDIGAALAGTDLIAVDDGAGGTNRKSAISRIATYVESTISGDITISGGTAAIGTGVIVNADINGSAAIDATKIHDGSVSNTEFGYLNGVTSSIQTQIDSKASAGFAVAMSIAL
jgi:hypothetical protein